uniref:Uncharacterized protein n=1 Tax=Megaselia scalaris TaxID=36166 RepID=T1H1L9_MEGSC
MKSEVNIDFLQQSFFDFKKTTEDGMVLHILNIKNITKHLNDAGEKISESMVTKISITLPLNYSHFYCSREYNPKMERTLQNLTPRLCIEPSVDEIHRRLIGD